MLTKLLIIDPENPNKFKELAIDISYILSIRADNNRLIVTFTIKTSSKVHEFVYVYNDIEIAEKSSRLILKQICRENNNSAEKEYTDILSEVANNKENAPTEETDSKNTEELNKDNNTNKDTSNKCINPQLFIKYKITGSVCDPVWKKNKILMYGLAKYLKEDKQENLSYFDFKEIDDLYNNSKFNKYQLLRELTEANFLIRQKDSDNLKKYIWRINPSIITSDMIEICEHYVENGDIKI